MLIQFLTSWWEFSFAISKEEAGSIYWTMWDGSLKNGEKPIKMPLRLNPNLWSRCEMLSVNGKNMILNGIKIPVIAYKISSNIVIKLSTTHIKIYIFVKRLNNSPDFEDIFCMQITSIISRKRKANIYALLVSKKIYDIIVTITI